MSLLKWCLLDLVYIIRSNLVHIHGLFIQRNKLVQQDKFSKLVDKVKDNNLLDYWSTKSIYLLIWSNINIWNLEYLV